MLPAPPRPAPWCAGSRQISQAELAGRSQAHHPSPVRLKRGASTLFPVDHGEYACAFSMFPTSIEDLMTIADAGGIMPPKSTWFEPKLRDAMFCHML